MLESRPAAPCLKKSAGALQALARSSDVSTASKPDGGIAEDGNEMRAVIRRVQTAGGVAEHGAATRGVTGRGRVTSDDIGPDGMPGRLGDLGIRRCLLGKSPGPGHGAHLRRCGG